MIVSNIASLLLLKQLSPSLMFLGTPLVMVFMYVYAREYESSITNFLGFFQIRTGWLPFAQMATLSATCTSRIDLITPIGL